MKFPESKKSRAALSGVTTLLRWGSLHVSITPRAMPARVLHPGKDTHAQQVEETRERQRKIETRQRVIPLSYRLGVGHRVNDAAP